MIADQIPPVNRDPLSFLIGDYADFFFLNPTTPQAVYNIILSLKNKASDINSVPIRVFKFLAPIISAPLSVIINKSFTSGVFPDIMKQAKVVPIKKTGIATDMNNYRPISILPAVSKIFEKIVHNQLYSYLRCKNIFYHNQIGFQCKILTIHAIINHVQYLYDSIDSCNIVLSLLLDFRKAFDLIDHKILSKLLYCTL